MNKVKGGGILYTRHFYLDTDSMKLLYTGSQKRFRKKNTSCKCKRIWYLIGLWACLIYNSQKLLLGTVHHLICNRVRCDKSNKLAVTAHAGDWQIKCTLYVHKFLYVKLGT